MGTQALAASDESRRLPWQPAPPWQGTYVQAADAILHVVRHGPRSGSPLVLLHGGPMWSFYYRAMLTTELNRPLLLVDLPGHGCSQAPLVRGKAFTVASEAFAAFFESLPDFDLVTHATATPAALMAVVRNPRQLNRLVISNAFGWSLLEGGKMELMARMVSSAPFRWAVEHLNFLPRVTVRKGRRTGPFTAQERAALLGPYHDARNRRHLANYLLSLKTEAAAFEALEGRIRAKLEHVPTLLLYGAHDNGYRAGFAQRWQELLPRAELVVLRDSAHFPFEDEPLASVDAIQAFLQDDPR